MDMDSTRVDLVLEPDRIVFEAERKAITGIGRSSWFVMMATGKAPASRQVSGRRTGWLLSDLVAWVKTRPIATNRPPAAAMAARGFGARA
jgi:predicted DNA-binding transcriptional regulator AlpA